MEISGITKGLTAGVAFIASLSGITVGVIRTLEFTGAQQNQGQEQVIIEQKIDLDSLTAEFHRRIEEEIEKGRTANKKTAGNTGGRIDVSRLETQMRRESKSELRPVSENIEIAEPVADKKDSAVSQAPESVLAVAESKEVKAENLDRNSANKEKQPQSDIDQRARSFWDSQDEKIERMFR